MFTIRNLYYFRSALKNFTPATVRGTYSARSLSVTKNEEFRLRLITSVKELESILIKAMVDEQWWPGLQDAQSYLASDPTISSETLIGELDGKAIGSILLTKYGDSFGFVGSFIMNKEYRERGYGRKIFDAALASVKPPSRNLAMVSLPHLATTYAKRGFREHFKVKHFEFHIPTALPCFSEVSEKSYAKIGCVGEVDQQALLKYDTEVFGLPRHAFLTKWLRAQHGHSRVAIDKEGAIAGFVATRPTFAKEEGYRIGPLYADSQSIAVELLKSVFEELLQQSYRSPIVRATILPQNAMAIAEKLQGKIIFDDLPYMSTKGLPNASFDKWFAITDYTLG